MWGDYKSWEAEVVPGNLTSHHRGQQSGGLSQGVPWLDPPAGDPTLLDSGVGTVVSGEKRIPGRGNSRAVVVKPIGEAAVGVQEHKHG